MPNEGTPSRNANEVLMLRAKLKSLEERAVIAKKSVLEVEKERDKIHKELEFIEVKLQGKRVCTHDDTGDGVGSCDNQPTPHTGKDGFLYHTRLGLVGWISYWCFGDSAVAVIMLVSLIKTLGLTELVSDSLVSRKQREVETNAKIVDLFKDAFDEIKHCPNEQQRVEFHIALA